MKTLTLFTFLTLSASFPLFSATNLSDAIDANEVEDEQEARENEVINQPDALDKNRVPQAMEERRNKEKWREDYSEIQDDMPRMNKKKK